MGNLDETSGQIVIRPNTKSATCVIIEADGLLAPAADGAVPTLDTISIE